MNVLRWVALLPGSLLAVIVAMFPLHWLLMLLQYFGREGAKGNTDYGGVLDLKYWLSKVPITTLEPICLSFVTPFVFVLAAAYIAPSHKFKTSIGMAILVLVGMAAGVAFVMSQPNMQMSDSGFVIGLKAVFLLAGLGFGIYRGRELERGE